MKSWKARLLALLTAVAMLVAISGPVMASHLGDDDDDDDEFSSRVVDDVDVEGPYYLDGEVCWDWIITYEDGTEDVDTECEDIDDLLDDYLDHSDHGEAF